MIDRFEKRGGEFTPSNNIKTNPNNRLKRLRGILPVTALAAGSLLLTACPTEADNVSRNLSTAAEEFEVTRRIVFLNGITDEVPLVIEGLCSIEVDAADEQLEVTCKTGPEEEYEKHFLGLSDNMSYVVEQTEPNKVDPYRTRVLIKPETLLPDFDLNTSLSD